MIDFLITGRPVLFFPYDYETYSSQDRGFYLPYDRYTPGKKVFEANELVERICDIRANYKEYVDRYKQQYAEVNREINLYSSEPNYTELLQFWDKFRS